MVARVDQLGQVGDFITGKILKTSFVVVRSTEGQIRAFHNVCRHHAAPVACGAGRAEHFECPYVRGRCTQPLQRCRSES
jgi:choline monooxygenase